MSVRQPSSVWPAAHDLGCIDSWAPPCQLIGSFVGSTLSVDWILRSGTSDASALLQNVKTQLLNERRCRECLLNILGPTREACCRHPSPDAEGWPQQYLTNWDTYLALFIHGCSNWCFKLYHPFSFRMIFLLFVPHSWAALHDHSLNHRLGAADLHVYVLYCARTQWRMGWGAAICRPRTKHPDQALSHLGDPFVKFKSQSATGTNLSEDIIGQRTYFPAGSIWVDANKDPRRVPTRRQEIWFARVCEGLAVEPAGLGSAWQRLIIAR
jgi:hypothetical protein